MLTMNFFLIFNSFDDSDSQPDAASLLVNGASPLKRKKLFDGSDDELNATEQSPAK